MANSTKKQDITKTATQWKARAKHDRSNRRKITRAQKFALNLLDYLEENDIKQVELAELMQVTPQHINKILRAKANLTFETIDKIEEALNVEISTPTIKAKRIEDSPVVKSSMVIAYVRPKTIEENIKTVTSTSKNPILETSIESMDNYKFTADQT